MALFRFEHHTKPVASTAAFVGRLTNNVMSALVLIAVALGAGMAGYHATTGMSWIDAFLNAAMLLGGMGPVSPLDNDGAKLFAGIYALVCGLLIVITSGVILAPILHRVLHAMHAQTDDA
jgi:hypothetical protein